eukprot:COSAG01_NODE_856_length_13082_cov_23.882009_1_plen_642_part_10
MSVQTPGSGNVTVSSLGAASAAPGWGGVPNVTCRAEGTFAVSGVTENTCAAKTAAQWAAVGVSVPTPGSGSVTVSSLGAVSAAPGWGGTPAVTCAPAGVISTLSTNGLGVGRNKGLAVTPDGSMAFAANKQGSGIRCIVLATGTISTLAGGQHGYAEGVGAAAQFGETFGLVVTPDGLHVVVTDQSNHRIRRVVIANGATSLLAGSGQAGYAEGTGASAQFNYPAELAVTPDGLTVLVADSGNHRIRRIVLATATVSLLAGSGVAGYANGVGATAQFNQPIGMAVTPDGATAVVADKRNHRIRRIVISTRVTSLLAGSGTAGYAEGTMSSVQFDEPTSLAVIPDGQSVLVASGHYQRQNNRIRRIVLATGKASLLAGSGSPGYQDGVGASAQFNEAMGVAVMPDGRTALISELYNQKIRRASLGSFSVSGVSENTCAAKTAAEWAAAGVSVQAPGSGNVTVSSLGAISAATSWSGVPNVMCGAGGTFAVLGVSENTCPAKTAAQWLALGLIVPTPGSGNVTVSSLGAVSAAPGWGGTPNVTCGAAGAFAVSGVSENTCPAKTAAQWAAAGVSVQTPGSGNVTVSSLGTVTAGWTGAPKVTCAAAGVFHVSGRCSGNTDASTDVDCGATSQELVAGSGFIAGS